MTVPPSPLLLTPEEAADALRIGRTRLYELLAAGEIASVKVGHSRRIQPAALQRYVERLTGDSSGDSPVAVVVAPTVHTESWYRPGRSRRRRRPRPDGESGEMLPLPFP